MTKWLKKKIQQWAADLDDHRHNGIQVFDNFSGPADRAGFNLRIYKARGGTIVETSVYDRQKDRQNNGLYIITDEKDLGEEINKIITMENLKL